VECVTRAGELSALTLRSETLFAMSRDLVRTSNELAVVHAVALAQPPVLLRRELDVVYPSAHRRLRDLQSLRDFTE
jgi:hypothetical protein